MSNSKPLNVLVSPNVAEAEETVKDAVSQRKTLLVVDNCWVHYLGRAKSKLEPGGRILIIKMMAPFSFIVQLVTNQLTGSLQAAFFTFKSKAMC